MTPAHHNTKQQTNSIFMRTISRPSNTSENVLVFISVLSNINGSQQIEVTNIQHLTCSRKRESRRHPGRNNPRTPARTSVQGGQSTFMGWKAPTSCGTNVHPQAGKYTCTTRTILNHRLERSHKLAPQYSIRT